MTPHTLIFVCVRKAIAAALAAILFLLLASIVFAQTPGQSLDQSLDDLVRRQTELERQMAAYLAAPRPATWEDFGARPNDRNFDNGPILSKMLEFAGGQAATNGTYYCATEITWPHKAGGTLRGSSGYAPSRYFGPTRIASTAANAIRYSGSGGTIAEITLEGTGRNRALLVMNDQAPPTGHLETRTLSVNSFDRGIETALEPATAWATEFAHYGLRFHGVKNCYLVNGSQSCDHRFYGVEFRAGCDRYFVFANGDGKPGCGGPLYVWGCYCGAGYGATLLTLGLTDSGTGCYEIAGLHVDGTAENLHLVEHGRRAHRVRISGNISSAKADANGDGIAGPTLAEPFVVSREGVEQIVDVRVDCRGAQYPSNP